MLRLLAMKKQEQKPDNCDHFTDCFVGRCRAGVLYDDVKDQNRRGQTARFPCARSHDAFTTCARAQFTPRPRARRRISLSSKNVGREVIYEQAAAGAAEKVRGLLVGWTDDGAEVFISVRPRNRKRRKIVAAPSDKCYLARKPAEERAATAAREMPLFDLRGVQARRRGGGQREKVTDKAA